MPIVTLTTDWGNGDYYLGLLKGRILACCPTVVFADITHHIQPFNTLQAAFVLRNAYGQFPQGSIHLVGVNSEPSPVNTLSALKVNQQYFIGTNDGMFSLLFDDEPDEMVNLADSGTSNGFRSLDLFATAVTTAEKREPLASIGTPCAMKRELTGKPTYDENTISGLVLYVDTYGNVITNITRELFERVRRGRTFEILVQSNFTKITQVSNYYDDVRYGKLLAIFNSLGLLELAINRGNIAQLESLDTKSSIRVKFSE